MPAYTASSIYSQPTNLPNNKLTYALSPATTFAAPTIDMTTSSAYDPSLGIVRARRSLGVIRAIGMAIMLLVQVVMWYIIVNSVRTAKVNCPLHDHILGANSSNLVVLLFRLPRICYPLRAPLPLDDHRVASSSSPVQSQAFTRHSMAPVFFDLDSERACGWTNDYWDNSPGLHQQL